MSRTFKKDKKGTIYYEGNDKKDVVYSCQCWYCAREKKILDEELKKEFNKIKYKFKLRLW